MGGRGDSHVSNDIDGATPMNRHRFVWLLAAAPALAACALLLRSYGVGGVPAGSPGGDPALECPSSIDIGTRDKGESVAVEFAVANRGGRTLAVRDVQPHCSCSSV